MNNRMLAVLATGFILVGVLLWSREDAPAQPPPVVKLPKAIATIHPRLSPDGNTLAFSYQGEIWTAPRTGGTMTLLTASEGFDTEPAWSPDGKQIAFVRGAAVRLAEFPSGKDLPLPKPAQTAGPYAWNKLEFSHDGKHLASASSDTTVKIWDVSDDEAREIVTLSGHMGSVYAVAFHPDGKHVASGSWDRTIRLWDIELGKQVRKFEGHQEDIWSVAFVGDGKFLVSGSEDRTAKRWEIATGKEVQSFKGHTGTIYGVDVTRDGRTLGTASRDGTVKIWDLPE